jgi:imidazolonepropionase-like amidohydrolase
MPFNRIEASRDAMPIIRAEAVMAQWAKNEWAKRRSQGATLLGLSSCLAAWAGAPTPFAPPKQDELVLYRHTTLIDGVQAGARPDMDVLVAGERILKVYPDASALPADLARARIVDLRSRYLIPGLIDAHVHLATPPNRRQAEAEMRRNLYGGVTAVRDMADDLRAVSELARASRVGEIPGPDIYFAALMAGPSFFTDPRTVQTSAGGVAGQVPWMQAVREDTDLPLAVARASGTFATAIKLYAALSPELTRRITAEAHRQHMRVWAHATLYPAKPSEVVAAGADAISHACLLVREVATRVPSWGEPRGTINLDQFRAGDSPVLARLFHTMARRGVVLDATVATYGAASLPPPDAVPASGAPPLTPGGCDDGVGAAITGQAYRAGVPISAGTDFVAPASEPWPELFREMAALTDVARMPADAVLRSATVIAARAAGQEQDMGTIEAGKLANMVVLSMNPLTSVEHLKSVVTTIKRGRAFERDSFVPLQPADVTDFY